MPRTPRQKNAIVSNAELNEKIARTTTSKRVRKAAWSCAAIGYFNAERFDKSASAHLMAGHVDPTHRFFFYYMAAGLFKRLGNCFAAAKALSTLACALEAREFHSYAAIYFEYSAKELDFLRETHDAARQYLNAARQYLNAAKNDGVNYASHLYCAARCFKASGDGQNADHYFSLASANNPSLQTATPSTTPTTTATSVTTLGLNQT